MSRSRALGSQRSRPSDALAREGAERPRSSEADDRFWSEAVVGGCWSGTRICRLETPSLNRSSRKHRPRAACSCASLCDSRLLPGRGQRWPRTVRTSQTANRAATMPVSIPRMKSPWRSHHARRDRRACARSGRRRAMWVLCGTHLPKASPFASMSAGPSISVGRPGGGRSISLPTPATLAGFRQCSYYVLSDSKASELHLALTESGVSALTTGISGTS